MESVDPRFSRFVRSAWASVLLGAGSAWLTPACSTEEPTETGCRRACPDAQGIDLMAPSVSFAQDIMPLFARSCSQQLCHGNPAGARAALYLGPAESATQTEIDSVHTGLLRASKTAPAMPLVTAGSPGGSFLLAKVEGCQNSLNLTCDAEPNSCDAACGDPMPPAPAESYPPISNDEKLALRRWIAQGAVR